jgi:hypothetical protein
MLRYSLSESRGPFLKLTLRETCYFCDVCSVFFVENVLEDTERVSFEDYFLLLVQLHFCAYFLIYEILRCFCATLPLLIFTLFDLCSEFNLSFSIVFLNLD